MTNAKVLIIILILTLLFVVSCNNSNIGKYQEMGSDSDIDKSFAFFDYSSIKIDETSVIDINIKSCNLYIDIYGNLVLLGELENVSNISKADLEITFDFFDARENKIFSDKINSHLEYLYPKSAIPFSYMLKEKENYIDISKVKIGLNYNNFYEKFKGNPIVKEEKYYYEDDFLIIEGELVNLGQNRIEEIVLLCTFYNKFDKVVFIRECYIPRKELSSLGKEKFMLKIYLGEYLPDFTDYGFSLSFKDSIKVKA